MEFLKWLNNLVSIKEPELTETSYTCLVCKRVGILRTLKNPHPALCSLTMLDLLRGPLRMIRISYGNINKRFGYVCITHKDKEIEKVLEEIR